MTPQPMSPELMLAATGGPQRPVETLTDARIKAMTLGNAMQQQQLGQQKLQAGQLELEQARRAMTDQDIIRQSYMDANGDLDQTAVNATKAGASPQALIGLQNTILDQKTKMATFRKEDLANIESGHDAANGALASYIAQPNLSDKQYNWPQWLGDQVKAKNLSPQDAAAFPQAYPGDDQAKLLGMGLLTSSTLAKQENEARDSKAKAQEAQTGANKAQGEKDASFLSTAAGASSQAAVDSMIAFGKASGVSPAAIARVPTTYDPGVWAKDFIPTTASPLVGAQTREAQITADKAQLQFNLMKNPQNAEAAIAQSSLLRANPAELDEAQSAFRVATQLTGDPNKGLEAVQKIMDRLGAYSPGTVAGDARKAAAAAWATSPAQIAVKQAELNASHAMEQNDKVTGDYYKSLADAKSSQATAERLQKVIDLSTAAKSNPVAAEQLKALVPAYQMAMFDIKRLTNIPGNEGLASMRDKLSSETASLVDGQPLSDNVLAALRPYVDTIANSATAQHNATVATLKQTYPQNPQAQRLQPEPMPIQYAQNKAGHTIVSRDGGKSWADAATGQPLR